MYYIRHPISRKEDKAGFDYYRAMKLAASHAQHEELEWFADLMLKGTPEAVSNFAMECLFLLRKSNGDVDRLVRLKNVAGEVSHGISHKGSDLLVGEAFGGPEKFRAWTLKRGNFSWSGNQIALQALHMDNTSAGAWRVINQVEFAGAMEVKRRAATVAATGEPVKESPLPRGWKMRDTLWFYGDCVYAEGQVLQADDDGIYWYEGEGYYPTVMGREAEFAQGKPKLRPNEGLYRKALIAGEPQAYELRLGRPKDEAAVTREFFLAVVKAAYETVGGYDGWLAIGMMLAYAAGPEIFAKYALFPGHWVHGQAASGKTLWCEWLMHLLGFNISSGIGLLATTTTVGLQQQLENYSSLALWADEYRQGTIKEEKEALLRDAYTREQHADNSLAINLRGGAEQRVNGWAGVVLLCTMAEPDHTFANQQMKIRWCNINPPRHDLRAIAGMLGRQPRYPLQNRR